MDKNTHYVYSDELYHYGRKGMKWGQNIFGKPRSGSKGRVVAKKKSLLDKAKEAQAAKKKAKAEAAEAERNKDPRNMSDADLRKAIDRKKLENEYRQYYPAKVSRGKKFVAKFLDESLTPALIASGKKFMGDAFDMFGKNLLDKYNKTEPSQKDQLKNKNELLKLKKDNLQMEKAIEDLKDTPYQKLIREAAEAKLRQTINGQNKDKDKDD